MKVEGVTVFRGRVAALTDVSLEFPAGQVTAVVGGDGAGKTTLLDAVVGLVRMRSGSVTRPPAEQIGFMPSGAGSWSDLTVAENVGFIGTSYGVDAAVLEQRAQVLLTSAGLMQVRDRLAGQLSGGMRTKLGFCLAMLHEPELLVLDEPSTGVDPVSRVELWRLISTAAARGTSVLMTTTYLDEAERAGSVLVLQDGRALLSGTADQIIASCPGTVVETDSPVRPDLAWRSGVQFREWWPHGAPADSRAVLLTLEDVCIVASLQAAA